jgi:hypothetical protein
VNFAKLPEQLRRKRRKGSREKSGLVAGLVLKLKRRIGDRCCDAPTSEHK